MDICLVLLLLALRTGYWGLRWLVRMLEAETIRKRLSFIIWPETSCKMGGVGWWWVRGMSLLSTFFCPALLRLRWHSHFFCRLLSISLWADRSGKTQQRSFLSLPKTTRRKLVVIRRRNASKLPGTDSAMCVSADGSWRIRGIMRWEYNCLYARVWLNQPAIKVESAQTTCHVLVRFS